MNGGRAAVGWRELDGELRAALAAVARIIWQQSLATGLSAGLAAACAWGVGVLIAARFTPLPDRWPWVGGGAAAALTLALLAAALRRPSPLQSAVAGDGAGLRERLVTALELRAEISLLARVQRNDAVAAARGGGWRSGLRVRWSRRTLGLALGLALIMGALWFLPNPMDEVARRRAALQAEAIRQAERLERAVEQLTPPGRAETAAESAEAAGALRRLQDELMRATDGSEALQEVGAAQEELERLLDAAKARQGQALQELGAALASSGQAESAVEGLRRGNWENARRGLEDLADVATLAGPEQREALARALEATALSAGVRSALAEALARAARALRSGENAAIAEALRQLAAMAEQAGRSADLQEALRRALAEVQEVREAMLVAMGVAPPGAPQGVAGQPGAPGQQGQPGATPGSGQDPGGQGQEAWMLQPGAGTGNPDGILLLPGLGSGSPDLLALLGDGQGEGGGSGQGQGNGAEGTGAQNNANRTGAGRNSSDRVSVGGVAGEPGQAGSEDPPRQYRDPNLVYAPSRLGGEGAPDTVRGILGAGPGQVVETERSPMGIPAFRPYQQVYAEYAEQAHTGLERAEVPPGVRALVKEYFSSLEPRER